MSVMKASSTLMSTITFMQQLPYSHDNKKNVANNTSHSTSTKTLFHQYHMQLTRTLADRDTLVISLINHLPPGALAASHTLPRADGSGVGAVGRTGRSTAGEELTFNRTLFKMVDKGRSIHPHRKQTGSELCVQKSLSIRVRNLYSVTTIAIMYIQLVWN